MSIDNALLLHFIRKETAEKQFILTMARFKEIAGYGALDDDDRHLFESLRNPKLASRILRNKRNDPKSKHVDSELVRYLGRGACARLGGIIGRAVATFSRYIGSTQSKRQPFLWYFDLDSLVLALKKIRNVFRRACTSLAKLSKIRNIGRQYKNALTTK